VGGTVFFAISASGFTKAVLDVALLRLRFFGSPSLT